MKPSRGEVWLVDFDLTRGHEQAGKRPGLVLSVDLFNQGPADLVVVAPMTTKDKKIRWHVPVQPPEAGLKKKSFIMSENMRSISQERLIRRYGVIAASSLAEVEYRLRILLNL